MTRAPRPPSLGRVRSPAGRLLAEPHVGEKRRGVPGARFPFPGSAAGARLPLPILCSPTGEARAAPFAYSREQGGLRFSF